MKTTLPTLAFLVLTTIISFHTYATEYEKNLIKEVDLAGTWKFSIMHSHDWYAIDFDDSDWDRIRAPECWESQGYNGYDGYGFYRKDILLDKKTEESQMYLKLGYIDDVDEVYFNGTLIGATGSFPPNYKTGYSVKRSYLIPASLIRADSKNTIAVKVFDMTGSGGIRSGDLGIYIKEHPIKPQINLVGEWKFSTENHESFKETEIDDSDWSNILVPGIWENQGFRNHDGNAWYRKEFDVDDIEQEEYMVLLLGKIDDIDIVYLNGEWIGQTGIKEMFERGEDITPYYSRSERSYVFPSKRLKEGKNVIAIHVYDLKNQGGIYDGLAAIVKQSDFVNYWRKRSKQ
jgi:sialate O-acetylesterase